MDDAACAALVPWLAKASNWFSPPEDAARQLFQSMGVANVPEGFLDLMSHVLPGTNFARLRSATAAASDAGGGPGPRGIRTAGRQQRRRQQLCSRR